MFGARHSRSSMPNTPMPAGFEEIQREELSRLFARVTHVRLFIVPVVIGLLGWLWVHGNAVAARGSRHPRRDRRGAVPSRGHSASPFRTRYVGIRRQFRLRGGRQATAALATGGLESPSFFAMFPIAVVGAAIVRPPVLLLVVAVQLAEIWGMAWVHTTARLPHINPTLFGGDALAGWNFTHILWSAIFASLGLGVVTFLGRGIRYSFDGMLRSGLEAREEILSSHAERARELAALSGEIAHELKNPLASIKGLSALIAQDASPGKPAERLQVLRREVDRMQIILDEFLNFSRPLVPLAIEAVDLRALVLRVVDMHEGMAHERGVRLSVKLDVLAWRCDPRKIEQALINLAQNAIEASPAGAAVEIDVQDGPRLQLCVLDRGPGVDAGLGDKVFEPGVTAKARGSGLGLTIVRALVRQHGGDLTLASREGGGCAAALRLPKEAQA